MSNESNNIWNEPVYIKITKNPLMQLAAPKFNFFFISQNISPNLQMCTLAGWRV